jgi:hypothetical protein
VTTVSAFWGDRAASRAEAARVVSSALVGVAPIDPLLATWRTKGRTRKQALMEPTIDTNAAVVEAATSRATGLRSEEMPKLGFSLAAWNGAATYEDEAGVSVTIGLHTANPGLRNSFVLNLPASWDEDDPRIRSLARALMEHLAPDEVVLFGNDTSEVLWPRR